MAKITDEVIDETNASLWKEAKEKYKTVFLIPKDVASKIGETVRALYVLQQWQKESQGSNPLAFMRFYSVLPDVAEEVVIKYLGTKHIKEHEKAKEDKEPKRKDKWSAFIAWANQNQNKKFATEDLCKHSGFSYQTTLAYVKTSPVFEKVKKGVYRIIPLDERERKS